MNPETFLALPREVRFAGARAESVTFEIVREGDVFRSRLENRSARDAVIREAVLFRGHIGPCGSTPFWGDGYNMLSQYGGTLADVRDIGAYSDRRHYRMPQTESFFTVYNTLALDDPGCPVLLMFTSCRWFRGELRFTPDGMIEAAVCTENAVLPAGGTMELEELFAGSGGSLPALFDAACGYLHRNHPAPAWSEAPAGWCSWYCYGPDINEDIILQNCAAIRWRVPQLRTIQIDDGYQAAMGDWLEPGSGFTGDIAALCRRISDAGFIPAIWVAPFIAEEGSRLFSEHSDWFVRDESGRPLHSDTVSFGGWRRGPWYMLDGSHPDAREYLRQVFSVMRREWGCRYFKLDANMWGALPFGVRYDPGATSVEAYRRGMEAILEGAGEDSFILGCNAPMWPSLGLVHGMRVTGDIQRSWPAIRSVTRESFARSWQHRRLWINDPDCVMLENQNSELSDHEILFRASAVLASGGLVLGSDRVADMGETAMSRILRLLPPTDSAARFDDLSCTCGRAEYGGDTLYFFFNPDEEERSFCLEFMKDGAVTDFWTGEDCEDQYGGTLTLPPHCARVFRMRS